MSCRSYDCMEFGCIDSSCEWSPCTTRTWEDLRYDIECAGRGQHQNMDRAWAIAFELELATGVVFDMAGI